MSEQFRLSVYARVEREWRPWGEGGYCFTGYDTERGEVDEVLAETLAHEKHLTESELAAELWCMETEIRSLSRDGYRSSVERYRAETLHRFATLDHAC